jgi:hypothetical protein
VIKFVSDLRQVGGFLRVLPFSSTNKTDSHDIAEILLKVVLNTINQTFTLIRVFGHWLNQTCKKKYFYQGHTGL